MKSLYLYLLIGCFACTAVGPLRAVAQIKAIQPQQTDTAGFWVAPGKSTEVVDASGRRYRLSLIATPTSPRHSLSLEVGAFPGCVDEPLFNGSGGCYDYDSSLWPGEYPGERLYYQGPRRVTGGLGISYGYRVRRWLEVGASLTYAGFYQNLFLSRDGSIAGRDRSHYLTFMSYARFSWLNRRSVRLYSSLHLGVQWHMEQQYFYSPGHYTYLAGHFTPFGIRVGRKLFGYAEVGIGMRGVFVLGIGYGFGGKSQK